MYQGPDNIGRRDLGGLPRGVEVERSSQAVSTLTAIILVVLLIQLWLLTIGTEELMAHRSGLAFPTLLANAGCFAFNLFLLKYLYDIDRRMAGRG